MEARAITGLPHRHRGDGAEDVDLVSEYADVLQIGTRNAQNFPLNGLAKQQARVPEAWDVVNDPGIFDVRGVYFK